MEGSTEVHPTAVVSSQAELGVGVQVGPYAVVGADVQLGDGTEVGPHAILEGRLEVGSGCRIFAGAVIGYPAQDLKYKAGTPSGVRIGPDTVIREYATIHRSSVEDGWTTVGGGCFIMANAHIAHDCRVGNHVILTNFAGLTGHVEVGDHAIVSGLTGIHQFVRIGTLAYVGGCSRVTQDVPPYFLIEGNPAQARGVNVVGLRRAGVPAQHRMALQRAFKLLYRSGLSTSRAVERIRNDLPASEYVSALIDFVRASKRGIC